MPERFKVVCIPCKALYECSALPAFYLLLEVSQVLHCVTLEVSKCYTV